MRNPRFTIPSLLSLTCLLAALPALAWHQVDGDLLSVGRADGTWWYGGRTGGLRLSFDRGSVSGELSGAILTDAGERLSERKGLVKGTVVEQRIRLVAQVEGATTQEGTRWRIGGTIVPSQGIASGTIEGGGSWQVTFAPVEDVAQYGYRAFKLLLDQMLAEPQAAALARHYFARRGQLKRYASWLLREPDDPRPETPLERADRLRALGEVNLGYLRLHQELWAGALSACQETSTAPEPGASGVGGLLAGGSQWTDPALWRVARREAPRLLRRWQERHDMLASMIRAPAGPGPWATEFPQARQENRPPSRILTVQALPRGRRAGVRGALR